MLNCQNLKTGPILLLLFLLSFRVPAQSNVGLRFFGLSIHPKGDENAFLMPRKLDDKGVFVVNLGAMASYEKFLVPDFLTVKVIQAFYADCANLPGGFSHIGVRFKVFRKNRHALFGGIGPTIIYRKNWLALPGYINPGYFEGGPNATWQHKWLWYGGEFEYTYSLNQKFDFAANFVPGYPKFMSLSVGLNYKFNGKATP